jgi:hypothetical protein
MKKLPSLLLLGALSAGVSAILRPAPQDPARTDSAVAGFAEVYRGLADSILANKRTEKAVVLGILQVERDLALAALDRARAGDGKALREAAERIGDFATEGGAIIEPIRNRLLQGGHHHHAQDSGPNALYDRGYVALTRDNKVRALGLAKRAAQLAEGSAGAAEIDAVRSAFAELAAASLR